MNTRELRIGNYVKMTPDADRGFVSTVEPVIVCGVGEGGITYVSGHIIPDVWIEGIPLTEEWLMKLGFQRTFIKKEAVWVTKHFMFLSPESGWCLSFKREGFVSFYFGKLFLRECQYVHQLQNLYFALTGEELILKL